MSIYNKSKAAYDKLKSRLIQNQLINQSEIQDNIQKLELLWDQNKLEYTTKNRIYIDYFTFADGIVELSNLREQFYYKISIIK